MTESLAKILMTWSKADLIKLISGKEAMNEALRRELGKVNKVLATRGIVIGLQNPFLTHLGAEEAFSLTDTNARN